MAYDRSPVKPIGAIVIAGLSLGTISPIISTAATLEEVAHCRAIEKATQRVSCFKSLKPGPKANTGDAGRRKLSAQHQRTRKVGHWLQGKTPPQLR